MFKGVFIGDELASKDVFGKEMRAEIERRIEIRPSFLSSQSVEKDDVSLAGIEVIIGTWGMPRMDQQFLDKAPDLKAVFYAAGSIKNLVTDAFWRSDITISTAASVNAIPVAEYVLSQILFCLKHGWQSALELKTQKIWRRSTAAPGAYRSTVGLVSLGKIGRLVAERLKAFDLEVIAFDPYLSQKAADSMNVRLCGLQELFAMSDVVSLHTPALPETRNLVSRDLLMRMKQGASLINTSRGEIIDEYALFQTFQERTDLFAVLDVTCEEPLPPASPFHTIPNIIITPHIAGSMNGECLRMGDFVLSELDRYLAGEPLQGRVTREQSLFMA